ncbi:uncharacterized protein LOC127253823 [Andrographis paniculata]|uniref:uncharacterized protein LOC127253823 n=1 Tax=Andrographis paniculata TaxID=175694 RepID=UPI0021E91353|nr:uncharacterized protein LOC127253823 [Andrographis paniculata]
METNTAVIPFDGSAPPLAMDPSSNVTPVVRPFVSTVAEGAPTLNFLQHNRRLAIHDGAFNAARLWDGIKTNLLDPKDEFRTWYSRVEKSFGKQWKQQGLDKAILLSCQSFNIQETFILAIAAFWDHEVSAFLLPAGPIGPTLMDVSMIAHLPIVGEDPVVGTLNGQEPAADHPGWGIKTPPRNRVVAWGSFVKLHCGAKDTPVTDEEHVAFLLYWLCRYVFLFRIWS